MGLVSALVTGVLLGIRHALEVDHLAAVATLVERERGAGSVGVAWGIGHSVPIVAVGLSFVVLGVRLPTAVTDLFEGIVGVILVVLGARMLWSASRRVGVTTHDHGHGSHAHVGGDAVAVGLTHSHLRGSSFLVGIVHGLAGSGALVIAIVSTAPTMSSALSFLTGFTLLSIVTMGAVSLLWGRIMGTRFTRYLKGSVGAVGMGVGAYFLAAPTLVF